MPPDVFLKMLHFFSCTHAIYWSFTGPLFPCVFIELLSQKEASNQGRRDLLVSQAKTCSTSSKPVYAFTTTEETAQLWRLWHTRLAIEKAFIFSHHIFSLALGYIKSKNIMGNWVTGALNKCLNTQCRPRKQLLAFSTNLFQLTQYPVHIANAAYPLASLVHTKRSNRDASPASQSLLHVEHPCYG